MQPHSSQLKAKRGTISMQPHQSAFNHDHHDQHVTVRAFEPHKTLRLSVCEGLRQERGQK
jgi:hypothetical protein